MENQNIASPSGQGQPVEAVPHSTAVLMVGVLMSIPFLESCPDFN